MKTYHVYFKEVNNETKVAVCKGDGLKREDGFVVIGDNLFEEDRVVAVLKQEKPLTIE